MLWSKIYKLYCLDNDHPMNIQQYIVFRIKEYDSEKDIFESFDDYIDYCINMLEDLI